MGNAHQGESGFPVSATSVAWGKWNFRPWLWEERAAKSLQHFWPELDSLSVWWQYELIETNSDSKVSAYGSKEPTECSLLLVFNETAEA